MHVTRDEEADVAVVGAGPVGMTAAALLAARGVRVVLLERNASPSDAPKAISIDDEALRTYQGAGLARRVLDIITPGTGTRYYDAAGEAVFHARSARPGRHGYPFKNPFAQPDLERELLAHLNEHPHVTTRMATPVTGLRQHPAGIALDTPRATVRARFVLGCDGGRSTVRELLDIGMSGRSYSEVWLVADVLEDQHDERYGMHHGDPDRPHVIIPGRDGRCRYEFRLHPGEGDPDRPPDPDLVRRLLRRHRDVAPEQIERAVNYRFHAVVADRWRAEHAFLLGDAAHMMPPFAGQGLNSGIRDAANLAWKLADVLSGRLAESALDSYEAERRPHTEATVRLSQRLGRIVMTTDRRVAERRDRIVRRAAETAAGRDFFEHMRYRPPQHYRAGLLVPDESTGVVLGQPQVFDVRAHRIRRLDDALGPGWAVLGVGAEPVLPSALADLAPVTAHIALDRMPASTVDIGLVDIDGHLEAELAPYRGCCVLLRPDRFVAAAWPPDADPDLREHLPLPSAPAAA